MARTQIGSLFISLSANASEFEKVLDGAQKRLTGFAAKLASPVSMAGRVGGSLLGMAAGPAGIAASAAGAVSSLFDVESSRVFDSQKVNASIESVMEKTSDLAREAKRLDFEPQFLRSLRAMAGPESAALETGITKYLKLIGESRGGDEEATKTLKRYGLGDVVDKSSTEAVRELLDKYSQLGNRADQASMGAKLLSRGAAGAHDTLAAGLPVLDQYIAKIEGMSIANKDLVAAVGAARKATKEQALKEEGWSDKEFMLFGAGLAESKRRMGQGTPFGTGAKQWWSGLGEFIDAKSAQWGYGLFGAESGMIRIPDVMRQGARPEHVLSKDETAEKTASEAADKYIERLDKEQKALRGVADEEEMKRIAKMEGISEAKKQEMQVALGQTIHDREAKQIRTITEELEKQADAYGLSAAQAKARQAALIGGSPAEMKHVRELANQADAAALFNDTRNPAEKAMAEFGRLKKLQDAGAIGDDAMNRGMLRALQGAGIDVSGRRPEHWGLAPGALKGSAEDVSMSNRAAADWAYDKRSPEDKAKEIQAQIKQMIEIQRNQLQVMQAIRDNGGLGVFPEE